MKTALRLMFATLSLFLATTMTVHADRGSHGGGGGGYSGYHGGGGGGGGGSYGYHGGGGSGYYGGVWVGPAWGWGGGWWGPSVYPYYVAPPVVIEQQQPQPQLYIQQMPTAEDAGYWYYCRKPEGYYPYVKKCPNGWMKVVPQPNPGDEAQ